MVEARVALFIVFFLALGRTANSAGDFVAIDPDPRPNPVLGLSTISASGRYIFGSDHGRMFRWDTTTANFEWLSAQGCGLTPEQGTVVSISGDGQYALLAGCNGGKPFLWTAGKSIRLLPKIPSSWVGDEFVFGPGSIEEDLLFCVAPATAVGGFRTFFRYRIEQVDKAEVVDIEPIGNPSGARALKCVGISSDGQVIAVSSAGKAYLWTHYGSWVAVDTPFPSTFPVQLSANGRFLLGYVQRKTESRAFVWSNESGFKLLDALPNPDDKLFVRAISSDGRLVIGNLETGGRAAHALLWREGKGWQILQDIAIQEFGLGSKLQGYTLLDTVAMTPSGRSIVGHVLGPGGKRMGYLLELDLLPQ